MKQIIADGKYGLTTNMYGAKKPLSVELNLWNRAMDDIAKNNTFCPDITRIIYNVGQKPCKNDKKSYYDVLTCTVFFNDDTKVVVTNSENDPVEFIEVNGVKTGSERSKEISLTYAICKKLIGQPNEKGVVESNGFGRILHELVTSAWDQVVEEKKARDTKATAHANHLKTLKTAKPKVKRESLAKTVDRLTSILDKLEANKLEANKSYNSYNNSYNKSYCQKPARKRDSRGRFI